MGGEPVFVGGEPVFVGDEPVFVGDEQKIPLRETTKNTGHQKIFVQSLEKNPKLAHLQIPVLFLTKTLKNPFALVKTVVFDATSANPVMRTSSQNLLHIRTINPYGITTRPKEKHR